MKGIIYKNNPQSKKMSKKSKGFTLIELLVVVAIIGILASVGVVAYNGYTTSTKNAAIKKQFSMICLLYTSPSPRDH